MGLMAGIVLLLPVGNMPEAFDGGGLGDAAAATPAASRFGMQMSPHNAAARQVGPRHCVLCWANKLQPPPLTDAAALAAELFLLFSAFSCQAFSASSAHQSRDALASGTAKR